MRRCGTRYRWRRRCSTASTPATRSTPCLPAFAPTDPGKENTTITPIPGDLCWFSFDSDDLGNPAYGYENTAGTGTTGAIVDLALFYGRNNLLINGDQGWVPGNVFGAVVEGLDEMAVACQDLWMGGVRSETLSFRRQD